MQEMIRNLRPDYCTHCNSSRAIEIYNFFNSPIGFSKLLDDILLNNRIPTIDKVPIYYARCRNCKTKFTIFWKDGIPVPYNINHHLINTFMQNYRKK